MREVNRVRSTDTYERNKAKRGARQSARAATRAAQEARVQALYDQAARAKREADEAAARLQREADEQRMAGVMARLSDAADHVQGFQHYIAYDGWPQSQWYWHDLASDAFEWRRSEVPADPLIDAPTRPCFA